MYTIERSKSLRGDIVIRDATTYHVVATIDHLSNQAEELLHEFAPGLALDILAGGVVPISADLVGKYTSKG